MGKVFRILNDANGLSMAELKQVSDNLLKMLGKASGVYGASGQKVEKCRKCGADKIVKFGKDKNGKQRYMCKCCGATFTEDLLLCCFPHQTFRSCLGDLYPSAADWRILRGMRLSVWHQCPDCLYLAAQDLEYSSERPG